MLRLRIFQSVDDHVVVKHFRLVDDINGVELVLAFRLGVRAFPFAALTAFGAQDPNDTNEDDDDDHGRDGDDERRLCVVHVFVIGSGKGQNGSVG